MRRPYIFRQPGGKGKGVGKRKEEGEKGTKEQGKEMGKEEKDVKNQELVGFEPLYNIQPGVKVRECEKNKY